MRPTPFVSEIVRGKVAWSPGLSVMGRLPSDMGDRGARLGFQLPKDHMSRRMCEGVLGQNPPAVEIAIPGTAVTRSIARQPSHRAAGCSCRLGDAEYARH
jgi:hypothetical protein